MIVADVDIVAYLLIAGDRSDAARAVWERDPAWRLPPLWRYEFLNILAAVGSSQRVSPADLSITWERALQIVGGGEQEPDLESALSIALEYDLSAYHAQYVALAL